MYILSGTSPNKVVTTLLNDAKQELLIVDKGLYIHIGPFVIAHEQNNFFLFLNKKIIAEFNSKKAAIAYAISEFNRTITQSNNIKRYDTKIGKHRNDISLYKRSLLKAQKHHDYMREYVMRDRIDRAYYELETTKEYLLQEIKKIKIG